MSRLDDIRGRSGFPWGNVTGIEFDMLSESHTQQRQDIKTLLSLIDKAAELLDSPTLDVWSQEYDSKMRNWLKEVKE